MPVIASGGAGTLEHLLEGVTEGGADAVLVASMFHFGRTRWPRPRAICGSAACRCGSSRERRSTSSAGTRRAHPRRDPGDRDRRGPHGGLDGPAALDATLEPGRGLLVPLASGALAEGRDVRPCPARRRRLRRLRSPTRCWCRCIRRAWPATPARAVLLHPARPRGRRRPRGRGGPRLSRGAGAHAESRKVERPAGPTWPASSARARRYLPEDRRGGHRGGHGRAGRRGRGAGGLGGRRSLVPLHGAAGDRGIPLRRVFAELARRHAGGLRAGARPGAARAVGLVPARGSAAAAPTVSSAACSTRQGLPGDPAADGWHVRRAASRPGAAPRGPPAACWPTRPAGAGPRAGARCSSAISPSASPGGVLDGRRSVGGRGADDSCAGGATARSRGGRRWSSGGRAASTTSSTWPPRIRAGGPRSRPSWRASRPERRRDAMPAIYGTPRESASGTAASGC